ncbi:Protein MSN1 [Nakaseomyces bracarensis]|uniref:Protein MSN1 n=1 Tax=Nakaseomyces bracarensis TaxID=273131 RepID=A0ABR4NTF3_9SACH
MNREGISGPGGTIITHDSANAASSTSNNGNSTNTNMANGSNNMNDDLVFLTRVNDIERRMMMFENMFHALSSRLDHHFKKYDVLVTTQQQQISELNAVISTLLNDQYRHAEFVRDKLSHSLHGISSTSISLNGISNQSSDRSNGFNNGSGTSQNSGTPNANSSTITGTNNGNTSSGNLNGSGSANVANSANVTHTILDDILNEHGLQSKKFTNNRDGNDISTGKDASGGDANKAQHGSRDSISLKKTKFIHHRQYNDVSDGDSVIPYTNPYVDQQSQQQNTLTSNILFNEHGTTNNTQNQVSNNANQVNGQGGQREDGNTGSPVNRKSFSSKRGPKKKKVMYHKPFQFIKSPHSVMEIWKEYTEGIDGQPSIRDMETLYQTGWRRDAAVNKRYSRRKVLWKAIETGLSRGYTLDYIIDLLENYRIIDPEKNTKQPIGWLCQVNNIPDLLK